MYFKNVLISCLQILKTVYASPSRVNFHLDSRKANHLIFTFHHIYLFINIIFQYWRNCVVCLCIQEVETKPAYPDICFAVDDFDSTFDAVVNNNNLLSFICLLYPSTSTSKKSTNSTDFWINRKVAEMVPAFKKICNLFLFQVLTDKDHCYCVLLNAVGGAAFPTEKPPPQDTNSPPKHNTDGPQTNKTKVFFFFFLFLIKWCPCLQYI